MPADPTPSAEELATLTAEERLLYDFFDDGIEGEDGGEYPLGAAMIRDLMSLRLAARREESRNDWIVSEAILECEKWCDFHNVEGDEIRNISDTAWNERMEKAAYWRALAIRWSQPAPPQEARHA